jgi:hypothetical protein
MSTAECETLEERCCFGSCRLRRTRFVCHALGRLQALTAALSLCSKENDMARAYGESIARATDDSQYLRVAKREPEDKTPLERRRCSLVPAPHRTTTALVR